MGVRPWEQGGLLWRDDVRWKFDGRKTDAGIRPLRGEDIDAVFRERMLP
jgi:hypothetical protein